MTISRRKFCAGFICAPFVIRNAHALMPVADRSQGFYTISGHDQFGRLISEQVYVSQQTMMHLHKMDMTSPEYAQTADRIFAKAFDRGALVDYNLYAVGQFFDGKPTTIIRDGLVRYGHVC